MKLCRAFTVLVVISSLVSDSALAADTMVRGRKADLSYAYGQNSFQNQALIGRLLIGTRFVITGQKWAKIRALGIKINVMAGLAAATIYSANVLAAKESNSQWIPKSEQRVLLESKFLRADKIPEEMKKEKFVRLTLPRMDPDESPRWSKEEIPNQEQLERAYNIWSGWKQDKGLRSRLEKDGSLSALTLYDEITLHGADSDAETLPPVLSVTLQLDGEAIEIFRYERSAPTPFHTDPRVQLYIKKDKIDVLYLVIPSEGLFSIRMNYVKERGNIITPYIDLYREKSIIPAPSGPKSPRVEKLEAGVRRSA